MARIERQGMLKAEAQGPVGSRAAAARLLPALVRLLVATLRLRRRGEDRDRALREAGRPPLYAFWHGRQVPLLAWPRRTPTAVLVSHSRDGAVQARVLARLGFTVARGSRGRGGAPGLMALARRVEEGAAAAFAVDGGRGPVHHVHEGVLALAARTGRPVLPMGASVRRRVVLSSWDRFLLPLPFSRAAVVAGTPLEVPPGASRVELRRLAEELARRLHAVNAEADALCGVSEPAGRGLRPCPVCAAALEAPGRPGI